MNFKRYSDFVFLETNRWDPKNRISYLFWQPVTIISCSKIGEVENVFRQVERYLEAGYYAAGFVAYEAGAAFEKRLLLKTQRLIESKKSTQFPLVWFGIYEQPMIYLHRPARGGRLKKPLNARVINKSGFIGNWTEQFHNPAKYSLKNGQLNVLEKEYRKAVETIQDFIVKGETYEVNYTLKYTFDFHGSPYGLYADLREQQRVAYSALVKCQPYFILSFSPELFFRKIGQNLKAKPMKGTISRGRNLQEDLSQINRLRHCPKNRSENLMIVDLLRNDLGRIARIGSVHTPQLFAVEKYETLFQMTSTIQAQMRPEVSIYELFRSLFPSGSVTGAPKIKTMQIIADLEKEPRFIYTGCIGFFTPRKDAVFNVAIRTVLLNPKMKKGELGLGSGIVYDSDPTREFAECQLKARFFTARTPDFQLLETLRWDPFSPANSKGGYYLLDLHLQRLVNSAKYFQFVVDRQSIKKQLILAARSFKKKTIYRVRLLLFRNGRVKVTATQLKNLPDQHTQLAIFSAQPTHSSDIFLFHKTTNRKTYDAEFAAHRARGFYDVIFQNEKGEITEGAISNIFIKKKDILYTPPVTCGLLNGTFRESLFRNRKTPLEEKILYKKDLREADAVYLGNSISKLVRVKLVENSEPFS